MKVVACQGNLVTKEFHYNRTNRISVDCKLQKTRGSLTSWRRILGSWCSFIFRLQLLKKFIDFPLVLFKCGIDRIQLVGIVFLVKGDQAALVVWFGV